MRNDSWQMFKPFDANRTSHLDQNGNKALVRWQKITVNGFNDEHKQSTLWAEDRLSSQIDFNEGSHNKNFKARRWDSPAAL